MEPKPLPPEFAAIPECRIAQMLPRAIWGGKAVEMKDACYGKAISRDTKPFNNPEPSFGLYDATKKSETLVRTIKKQEIKPDVFKFYKLGTFVVPESSYYHFGNWNVAMMADELFERDAMPGAKTAVYFSLKFEGPLYGGKGTENKIWCDRIVHIKEE